MKLNKGDKIMVLSGKDKGKTGKIEKVFVKSEKALIAGVNLYKRHLKKQSEKNPGGIIEIARPLPLGKISLICPKCNLTTRVGFKIQNEKKMRVCKKCQKSI